MSPTLGSLLRLAFGAEQFRLQFVSVAIGLVWFAWYWRRHGKHWNWTEQLPLLVLVSFVTAPYGAWPFDMVLLLPAAVRLLTLTPPRRLALYGLLAVNLGCLVLNVLKIGSFWFLWVGPAVLVLYALCTRPACSLAAPPSPAPEREAVAV